MKNTRVATLNTDIKGFFFQWLRLTQSFHKLTPKEQDVLGLLLFYYHEAKKDVKKERMRWRLVFDYDTKIKIKEELGIKDYALQNLLTSLRKKGAIKDKRVHPSFMPILTEDVSNFKIIFNINIDDK